MASAKETMDVRQSAPGGDFSVIERTFFEAAEQIEAGAIEPEPYEEGWRQVAQRLRSRLVVGGAVMTALLVVGGGLCAGSRQEHVPTALVQVEGRPRRALPPPPELASVAPAPVAVPAPAAVASEGYRVREHVRRRGGHHKRR